MGTLKVRASVGVDKALLKKADRLSKEFGSRSELVETALREYLKRTSRRARGDRDLEVINKNAESLNREAMDSLDYQVSV